MEIVNIALFIFYFPGQNPVSVSQRASNFECCCVLECVHPFPLCGLLKLGQKNSLSSKVLMFGCELLPDSQQLLSALTARNVSSPHLSHMVTGCLIALFFFCFVFYKGPIQSEPHAHADTHEDCVSPTGPPTIHAVASTLKM